MYKGMFRLLFFHGVRHFFFFPRRRFQTWGIVYYVNYTVDLLFSTFLIYTVCKVALFCILDALEQSKIAVYSHLKGFPVREISDQCQRVAVVQDHRPI